MQKLPGLDFWECTIPPEDMANFIKEKALRPRPMPVLKYRNMNDLKNKSLCFQDVGVK